MTPRISNGHLISSVSIGKYESNHTVQALVISHLDHMMASYEALLELVQDPNLERSKAQKVIRTLDSFLRPDSGLALPSSSLESGSWEQDDSSGYSQNSSIGKYILFSDRLISEYPESDKKWVKSNVWYQIIPLIMYHSRFIRRCFDYKHCVQE